MGFRLERTTGGGAQNGIHLGTVSNIAVTNGVIRGWVNGIYGLTASRIQLEDLRVSNNFVGGITLGDEALVAGCTVSFNSGSGGIHVGVGSLIRGCAAFSNDDDGIFAGGGSTIEGCTADNNGARGIALAHGTITACAAYSNTGDGIATGGGTIKGCNSSTNTGNGISVLSNSLVIGNTCDGNGQGGSASGIYVQVSDNRIDGNHVTDNDRGIDAPTGGNLIIRNSASGNTTNYNVVGTIGPIVNSGNIATNSNPHANYEF